MKVSFVAVAQISKPKLDCTEADRPPLHEVHYKSKWLVYKCKDWSFIVFSCV